MNRIFHHYSKWEDCKNGILKDNYSEKEVEEMTQQAKRLLCNLELFYCVAIEMIKKWKYSAEQHLSNTSRNRQAWIGQASCCYKYGIPEYITKYAWRLMTKEEQDDANYIANGIINLWEKENAKKIS